MEFDLNTIKDPEHRSIISVLINSRLSPSTISKRLHIGKARLYTLADNYLGKEFMENREKVCRASKLIDSVASEVKTAPLPAPVIDSVTVINDPKKALEESQSMPALPALPQNESKGREFVTCTEVLKACRALYFEGKRLTVSALRRTVGKGAIYKIRKLLEECRHMQDLQEPTDAERALHPNCCSEGFKEYLNSTSAIPLEHKEREQDDDSSLLEINTGKIKLRWHCSTGESQTEALVKVLTLVKELKNE